MKSTDIEKFPLTEKIIRQINFLGISFVKMSFSRIFSQKSAWHTLSVEITEMYGKIPSNQHLLKNFHSNMIWRKKLRGNFTKYFQMRVKCMYVENFVKLILSVVGFV